MPETVPPIPDQLWMFWLPNGEDQHAGWLVTNDDAPQGPTYLVAFSESDARNAALHQENTYDLENVTPVRVK